MRVPHKKNDHQMMAIDLILIHSHKWFITPSRETTFSPATFLFNIKVAMIDDGGNFILSDSIFATFFKREGISRKLIA